jgi:hypothetical protein
MLGLALYLIGRYPWFFAIVAVVAVVGFFNRPTRCQVCSNPLGRSVNVWTIDGKKQRLCSHCNQTMQRRQSSEAMRRHR